MPGFVEEEVVGEEAAQALPEYSVLKQRVDLDIDFARQSLKGSTEITIQPLVKELRRINLHCRQCKPTAIRAGGITATYEYDDPYRKLRMPGRTTVHQHDMLKSKIARSLQPAPAPELAITLPAKLKIQELQVEATGQAPQANGVLKPDADAAADTPTVQAVAQQLGPQFAPIKLFIEFEVSSFRDGIHWLGCDERDQRFPCMYTKAEPWAGNTSCIFPCVDDATSRCSWEFSIRCPRTLGDAFRKPKPETTLVNGHGKATTGAKIDAANGTDLQSKSAGSPHVTEEEYFIALGEDDAALDLAIVCVGEQTDDTIDAEDETRHSVTFSLNDPITARHIGFAIGPFEKINLSSTRDADEEERLGQSAVKVDGYCLPGRGEEVRNTCFPLTRAIDHFGVAYGSYPFSSYQVIFVDDLAHCTIPVAGMSFCTSHLLFPEKIINTLETNTRVLIRAVADQWAGVSVIPKEPTDAWAVAGIAGYMTDLYGKLLFGNNAYRWQQKLAAEKVYDLDADRPSIFQHGLYLHLDRSIREFLDLKSALVMFILDRRLLKTGNNGVTRVVNRIFLTAKTGTLENGELSTADLQRTCERLAHAKLDSFFKQWVLGAGAPIFSVEQRYNKKKVVVELIIKQRQLERQTKPEFAPDNFMREIKEHVRDVWAPEIQPVFTGPMTIRIHEADGTPYEHIVEIKEQLTKLEIPYNTKYKRLKRSRRQKERTMAAEGNTGEGGEDALLYCLGDILDTPEEVRNWNLVDWTAEDEEKMGQEHYEWIRLDADFEWIGKMHLVMPLYMYISQLQQDRDLVAQYESMRYLMGSNPHHVSLSILVRTLMDRRYFHGIREMAAEGLAMLASNRNTKDDKVRELGQFHLQKAFEEMFCFPGEIMPRPNDWTDRVNYIMQCAIPRAMVKLRDHEDKVPMTIRRFFIDKLRFNDNSDNEFSDCHYIATLMDCLADSLVISHREPQPTYTFSFGEDEPMEEENPDEPIEREAVELIDRLRRLDEFVTTYQNVCSITALDCLQKLVKAGLVKDKAREVLQYTRDTNADLVRLKAFACLTETGLTRRMPMMRYLLQSIAEDPSPFVRNRLLAIFGEALGHIALGDSERDQPAVHTLQPADADGLVLEQEASTELRRVEATRKTTPEGAVAALGVALGADDVFKQALWYAATSPLNTLDEAAALCDIAALLFTPVLGCTVVLKLPQMYICTHLGRGKLRFTPHGRYRKAPQKQLSLDDWQDLQEFGLVYNGPASTEVNLRRKSSLEDEMSLKQRVAELQAPIIREMPPPAPTTTVERSGFRLSLGAPKRKPSEDLTSVRAASPKAQKLSKQSTPNGFAKSPPPKGRSPSVATQRRGSTPAPRSSIGKPSLRKPIILRLATHFGRTKAKEILAKPPQPGGPKTLLPDQTAAQRARSITPVKPLPPTQPASSFVPAQSLLQSPSGGNSFYTTSPMQAPSMNLGGFRSYGPAPEISIPATAPQAAVKREATETVASPRVVGTGHSHKQASLSASPLPESSRAMPPPPKPRLKIKLGRKPSSAGPEGSPQ